ncbi:hypothetical protein [Thiolapillus sp.]|nr:hypothetical protein [Thiolapillus sp.]
MLILRKVLKLPLIATFAGVVGSGILLVGFLFNAILIPLQRHSYRGDLHVRTRTALVHRRPGLACRGHRRQAS